MDWISSPDCKSNPVQMDLDWTGLLNHLFNGFWTGLVWKSAISLFHIARQIVIVIKHNVLEDFWQQSTDIFMKEVNK